ncbi:MAG: HAD family phosphatase [bacterium]
MIKAIIFDIGDVLITNVHIYDHIVKELHLDKKKAFPFYVQAIEELEAGQIDEARFWIKLKKQLLINQPIPNPSPLVTSHKKVKVAQDVIDIVIALKQKGYKLGLLSNTIKAHKEEIEKLGFFHYFDVKIFSYEVKERKPFPNIYKLTLEQLNVLLEEAVFIDNNDSFVKGAERVGITGIQFINSRQLKRDLHKLEINIRIQV